MHKANQNIISNRLLLAVAILTIALIFTLALSISQGAVPMSLSDIWQALLHKGDPLKQTILWDLRMPRILASMLVGAALGMSGALLQGMLRNSLASPFILGISAGAGLVTVAMIVLELWTAWIPFAAWLGAIFTAITVIFLGRGQGGIRVEK